jgi:hypothetical protein
MTSPGMSNLNWPAAQAGELTEAELDRKQRDLGAWLMLAEPLPIDASEQIEPEPAAEAWWVWWIVYPAVLVLTILSCFRWPLWVQP